MVGVHGVNSFDAARTPSDATAALADRWRGYLADGPLAGHVDRVDLRMAYYAPHVAADVSQAGANLAVLNQRARDLLVEWALAYGVDASGAQGRLFAGLRNLVAAIANLSGVPEQRLERVVARFFPEVAAYFDPARPERRDKVRTAVADLVRVHRPHVVVTHSLGSVVTYEALHRYPHEVPLLLTFGSPTTPAEPHRPRRHGHAGPRPHQHHRPRRPPRRRTPPAPR